MTALPDRLPSRPLRNWFLAWHIATGDPAPVIANGFDLSVELVAELLDGTIPPMIATEEAMAVCQAVRIDAPELWLGVSSFEVVCADPLDDESAVAALFGAPSGPSTVGSW